MMEVNFPMNGKNKKVHKKPPTNIGGFLCEKVYLYLLFENTRPNNPGPA